MNEKNNVSDVVAGKLCTAFYPEDLLAIEHDLISEVLADGFSTYDEDLAYIRGVVNSFEAVFKRMKKRAEE